MLSPSTIANGISSEPGCGCASSDLNMTGCEMLNTKSYVLPFSTPSFVTYILLEYSDSTLLPLTVNDSDRYEPVVSTSCASSVAVYLA